MNPYEVLELHILREYEDLASRLVLELVSTVLVGVINAWRLRGQPWQRSRVAQLVHRPAGRSSLSVARFKPRA